jgi:hypothetical protein
MDGLDALFDLQSTKCRCGKAKRAGSSFCPPCLESLSVPLRVGLTHSISKGYVGAYTEACAHLDARQGREAVG